MKALSLNPLWALSVFMEYKTVECRTWPTKHRGDLLICSTAQKIPNTIAGRALCVVDLVDCVPFTEEHLEAAMMEEVPEYPSYAWIFENMREVQPIPVKGQQRLYSVKDSLIEYLPDNLTEAEAIKLYEGIITPEKPEKPNKTA